MLRVTRCLGQSYIDIGLIKLRKEGFKMADNLKHGHDEAIRCDQPTPLLGYALVPNQCLRQVYDEEKALYRGTIFPELDLPYGIYGREGFLPW